MSLNLPVEKIIYHYQSGKTMQELSHQYNCSINTIRSRIPRGMRRGRGPKKGTIRDPQKATEMIRLRRSGKTYREIGEQFGMSRQGANHFISRHWSDMEETP